MGHEPARYEFRQNSNPLPLAYLEGSFSVVGLLIVLPFGEELWRCLVASR